MRKYRDRLAAVEQFICDYVPVDSLPVLAGIAVQDVLKSLDVADRHLAKVDDPNLPAVGGNLRLIPTQEAENG